MTLESIGILIGLRPFGERDLIAKFFTREYGMLSGILRAGQIAKKKSLVGQMGAVSWNARLESNLGSFHFEPEKNLIANIMLDGKKITDANEMFELIARFLPEREKNEKLYDEFEKLLCNLTDENILSFEILMLCEMGFALDVSRCSNCGTTQNLTHISQKTGRAVCEECARPWTHRCFELPISRDITKYFLNLATTALQ